MVAAAPRPNRSTPGAPYELYGLPDRAPVRGRSRADRQANMRPTPRVQRRLDRLRAIIEADRPIPGRTIWYRAKPAMPEEYPVGDQRVVRTSVARLRDDVARLRRTGAIGWDDVTDIVSLDFDPGFGDAREALVWLAAVYRQDIWADADVRVAVTVESEQLWDALRRRLSLPVPIYGLGGHPSLTLKAGLAAWLGQADDAIVLHVGDADGMGFEIQRCLAEGLAEHGVDADVRRIWLYPEQAEALGLDHRVLADEADKAMDLAWGFGPGDRVYEAEAAPTTGFIADLIQTEVSRLVSPLIATSEVSVQTEREIITNLVTTMGGAA